MKQRDYFTPDNSNSWEDRLIMLVGMAGFLLGALLVAIMTWEVAIPALMNNLI